MSRAPERGWRNKEQVRKGFASHHASAHVTWVPQDPGSVSSFTSAGPKHHYALYSSPRCSWTRVQAVWRNCDCCTRCAPFEFARWRTCAASITSTCRRLQLPPRLLPTPTLVRAISRTQYTSSCLRLALSTRPGLAPATPPSTLSTESPPSQQRLHITRRLPIHAI